MSDSLTKIYQQKRAGNLELAIELWEASTEAEKDSIPFKQARLWIHFDYIKNALNAKDIPLLLMAWRNPFLANENLPFKDLLAEQYLILATRTLFQIQKKEYSTLPQHFEKVLVRCINTTPSYDSSFLLKAIVKHADEMKQSMESMAIVFFSLTEEKELFKKEKWEGKSILSIYTQTFYRLCKSFLIQQKNANQSNSVEDHAFSAGMDQTDEFRAENGGTDNSGWYIQDGNLSHWLGRSDKETKSPIPLSIDQFLAKILRILHNQKTTLPQYGFYYVSELYAIQGNLEKQLLYLIAQLSVTPLDWVFRKLGECVTDATLKEALLIKALSLSHDLRYSLNALNELIHIYENKEEFNNLSWCVQTSVKVRESEGWKIPQVINHWLSDDRYTPENVEEPIFTDEMNGQIFSFLKNYGRVVDAVVQRINTNANGKTLISLLTLDGKEYWVKNKFLNRGDVVSFIFTPKGHIFPIIETKLDQDHSFVKEVSGKLHISEKGDGFIKSSFIPSTVVQKHKLRANQIYSIRVILTMNAKKKSLGWLFLDLIVPPKASDLQRT